MKPLLLLLPPLAAWLVAGCHRETPPAAGAPALPPAVVELAVAIVGTNQAVEQVVGTVRPRSSALVAAEVSGRLKSLRAAIGQRVTAGELLAEIDAAEIGARVEQSRAALDNARKELDRYQKLLEQKAVTQSEFDAVESRARIATAALAEAQTMLGYTRVTAPFAGVVARKLADAGDLAAPGRPLVELESLDGLRFEADVPEALASRVQAGEPMPVVVDGLDAGLTARVAEIAPAANPLSRTLLVKLDLPAQAGLRAGQFGRLAVPVKAAANVRVPTAAVLRRGQLEIVFVAVGGRAQLRLVKTGKRLGAGVEILSGLESGESVVVAGHAALREGQPLTVK